MTSRPLDRRALALALSRIANADTRMLASRVLPEARPSPARRIGITGAPGTGKSTLLGHLARERKANGRIGVLAIDPSSPHSGGAILGDRVRMDELTDSADLYIRSVGSRGATDGLADNLPEMLDVMEEFDFAEVLLETVGVGQTEYAVRIQVDTLILLLQPDSGDIVQAMKAGIMEMADIFVVNKADLAGAQRMVADLQRISAINPHPEGTWRPPVLLTSASDQTSVLALSETIDRHQSWLAGVDQQRALRGQRARYRLRRLIEARVADAIARQDDAFLSLSLQQQVTRVVSLIGNGADQPAAAAAACADSATNRR